MQEQGKKQPPIFLDDDLDDDYFIGLDEISLDDEDADYADDGDDDDSDYYSAQELDEGLFNI